MNRNRARITYTIIGGTLCLAAWAATAMPRRTANLPTVDPPAPTQPHVAPQVSIPKAPPRVEVIFALDTTGSMSGMIDGAKRKIWSLAQFIASGQPKPEVRIGLVGYRDRGDAYITRFYDLSEDLDQVFAHLEAFQADGGGDGPEDVNRALSDAINKGSWSEGQNVLKMIYVVGDAPPHDDYTDQPDSRALAKRAHDKGIHINTIRCGTDATTQVAFARMADIASGEFASIDQTGGVRVVSTPYDDKLNELNTRLMGTAVGYGASRGDVARKVATSMHASAASNADRASFFGLVGKGGAVGGEGDLVADVMAGKTDAASVAPSDLPAPVAAMPAAARSAFVKEKARERATVTAEITKLAEERNAYLKKNAPKDDSFDGAVQKAMKRQAKEAGLDL